MVCEGGGTVQNTLKGSGTEKRGGETKISKRGSKLGQGVGALKGGGAGTPLQTPLWSVRPTMKRISICVFYMTIFVGAV